ncbi:hypothetical protein TcYC6_0005510 [Trypanosoma cruzi]|nr:hypothetical protein TcYC6_0005510 [Trypanosoma cruzi]
MVSDVSTNWLQLLLKELRRIAAQLQAKPLSVQDQTEYAAAVQFIELRVPVLGNDEWKALVSSGAVSEVFEFAVGSVLEDPLSCIAVQSWAGAMDALLARTKPSVSAAHHIPQLWDAARRLAKDRSGNNVILHAALKLLRVFLHRSPVNIDCTPRYHLPHPVKTVSVAPRLAALELVPYIILQPYKCAQQQQQYPQEERTGSPTPLNSLPRRLVLAAPWVDYLRKAVGCSIPVVREKALESIFVLLKEGVVLDTAQFNVILDMMLRLAESEEISSKIENVLGTVIGFLLNTAQHGSDWTHFAATNAADAGDMIRRIFHPRAMTHATQRVLSVAIGELLVQTVSSEWMENAVARIFELLQPTPYDDRMYMPTIVSRAVLLWASRMGSDMFRGSLVEILVRFLDASCTKSVTHTALLCLTGVVRMIVATSDFATVLWAQLLQIPVRHPSLMQVTSEAMACLAHQNEVCGRALLRRLYTASTEIETDKPLPTSVALHAKALLAMPAEFLQRPCVLETLRALFASFSIGITPPKVEVIFFRRVEYFNRIALLLLKHQRDQLSPATVTNLKMSVRVFLSLLVSNPSGTSLYARAASSACAVIAEVGASDIELKLVFALLDTLEAAGFSSQQSVWSAAYALFTGTPWLVCSDGMGKRGILAKALADVSDANRDGVPCAAEEQGEISDMGGTRLVGVAEECLDDYQRLLPNMTQKPQAVATWRAVSLIVGGCTERAGEECVQRVFVSLREWCAAAEADPVVTAWNVLCCLNGIFARCDSEHEWVKTSAMEWFTFVEEHWLSSSVWAVRRAAAQLLARLAVITGQLDDFTSVVVKNFNDGEDAYRLSGVLLALGEMHGTGSSATASMAISFVLRVLRQHGVSGGMTVAAAALVAMVRMTPRHSQLINSVLPAALVAQLLLPAMTTIVDPFVFVLLLELFLILLPHEQAMVNKGVNVCVRGVIQILFSSRALHDEVTSAVLNTVRLAVNDPNHTPTDAMANVSASFLTALNSLALKKEMLGLLEGNGRFNDSVSRAAAEMLGVCCSVVSAVDFFRASLLRIAQMLDAAVSTETRNAWINVARIILQNSDRKHLSVFLEEMELIMRGKPAQLCDGECTRHEPLMNSNHEEEMGELSSAKKTNMNGKRDDDEKQVQMVASEVGSKLAVLSLMTEMMRQPDLYVNLEGDALVRYLNLLFWSVSLAEVEPLFIRPAVNALLIVVEKYGNRVKDISTPFLLPWRVMLVSGMRRVIQSSVFCCEESCLLAESFINCNLADDNSVRRVVLALMTLLETLERCDADYEAIVHGGCGRVVLALSACRTRAAAAGWLQAEEAALEALASLSGQAAVALISNQLVASMAMVHGFEPAYDMSLTTLDECTHADLAAVLGVLENMCSAVQALGPTVRHAAGCLLCLVICTPGVALRPLRTIVPLLSTKHQELIASTAFGLLLQEGDEALNDEDATYLLEIAAATTCEKSAAEVETVLLALATHHRPCVGSLASLRLAVEASCSVACINTVLRSFDVDVLVVGDEPTPATRAYMQHISEEKRREMALATACGFVLLQLINLTDEQQQPLFVGSRVMEAALSRLMEALARSADPLALLQHVFPKMHQDVRLCSIIFTACSSAHQPELRRQWSPCVQHALLCIIHKEMLLQEKHSSLVLERVRLFIRALLILEAESSFYVDATDTMFSLYPDACAALTQQLMRHHVCELKSVIQSLCSEKAATLRRLMQLQGFGETPHESSLKMEGGSKHNHTATAVPQRLTINLSSYT